MNAFRSITLIIALLVQALPVSMMAGADEAAEKCSMSCCAWQKEAKANVSACGCVEAPEQTSQPAPTAPPPVSGRDLLTQPQWVAEAMPLLLSPAKAISQTQSVWHQEDRQALSQPHVRLSVLFCSFLT